MTDKPLPTRSPPASRFRWGSALRALVAVAILAYLAQRLDWSEVGRQLVESDPRWAIAATLLFGLAILVGSVRWQLLLSIQGIGMPLRQVYKLTLIGQFFNTFLLGTAGGDLVKIVYVVRHAPKAKTRAVLSILVDRAMGLFVLLCFSLIALSWLVPQIDRYPQLALLARAFAIVLVIFVLGGIVLLGMPYGWLPDRLQSLGLRIPRRQTIASLIGGLRSHLAQPRMTLAAMSLSVLVHLLVFTGAWCIARAIGLPANFTQVMVAVSVTVCLTSIPISLGGHGVREGAFVLLFAVLGVIDIRHATGAGQEAAVLFSLLFFALLAVWGIAGGWLYLFGRRS